VKRETKEKVVQDLKVTFEKNSTFYLVDFRGMAVSQAIKLRNLMRENSYVFLVVKNRLALHALRTDIPDNVKEMFQGQTAIAFAPKNPIGLARLIENFSKENNVLAVKGGIVEGQFMQADRFGEIANLTSREDLLGRVGFFLAYPLTKLLRTWQAPLSGIGTLLSQLKTKK
jgi:large subunit ribosomal protein L10